MSDTITIQDRLSSLSYEMESYNRQLKALENDVDYSQFSITVDEVIYYTDTTERFSSDIAQRWAEIFTDYLTDVLPGIFLVFISILPFAALVIFIIVFSANRIRSSKKKVKGSEEGKTND